MMEIQCDNPVLAGLLTQLAAQAGGRASELVVKAGQSGLSLISEKAVIQHYDFPVKLGTVLNFVQSFSARPAIETLPEAISLGSYQFRPRQSCLYQDNGDSIILTDKERDILASLWLAPGKSLDRAALLAAVWAYAEGVETHTLETHIYRLRQKIETDPGNPALLVNRDGTYRLNA